MKFLLGLICGIVCGGVGVFLWLVWYFRDVYR